MYHTDRLKYLTITGMLAASILLTVYFHAILKIGSVFTHFFYVPIILAALWWGRKGISIALFLGFMLVVCHWLLRPDLSGPNDYFRAGMFALVSLLVVMLRNRILASEQTLKYQSAELQQRVQALSCLYAINRLREKGAMPLEDIFQKIIKLLEEVGFEGTTAKARIIYQGHTYGSENLKADNATRLSSPIIVDQNVSGQLDIVFPENPDAHAAFLGSARELTDTVTRRIASIIEHENARVELDRHRHQLEMLVRERTEELVVVNRQLREEIAERLRIERSLRDSEHQYRILFENANDAIFIAQDDQILFPNPALTHLSGYSNEQLVNSPFMDLLHPEDAEMVYGRYQQRLEGRPVPNSYEFRIIAADGTPRWVENQAVVIRWKEKPATLNFLRDISSRKKIETSMAQIQKMEAISVLAAGIAHKFNNALSAISGSIDLLRICFPDHPEVKRYCQTMFKSVDTMVGLTRQLLAYARGGKYQARRQSLPVLVRDVLQTLEPPGDKTIRLETRFAPDTPEIEGDAVQLRMVLQAVLSNSAEAVKNDGHIRIETNRCRLDASEAAAFEGLSAGEYAGLCITDDGIGMTEATSARVFEPFFTTKFLGRGMEMPAVYGIIKNHGGYIYIDSEVLQGTVVHIFLPIYGANLQMPKKDPKVEVSKNSDG